jgi:hypothetical protein
MARGEPRPLRETAGLDSGQREASRGLRPGGFFMRRRDSVRAYSILISQVSTREGEGKRDKGGQCTVGRTEHAANRPPRKLPGVKNAGKGGGTVAYTLSLCGARVCDEWHRQTIRSKDPPPRPPGATRPVSQSPPWIFSPLWPPCGFSRVSRVSPLPAWVFSPRVSWALLQRLTGIGLYDLCLLLPV